MDECITYIGLDVHKETIAVALAEGSGRGEVCAHEQISNTPAALSRLSVKLSRPGSVLRFCYEAGPCGYGIQRQLAAAGHDCVVVAPSLIPRKLGDRIKTDRRDAINLAKLHRADALTTVWIPDPAHEAMRDLVRARLAAVRSLRQARQQLSGFLLRHGRHHPRPDQHLARATGHHGVCMTGGRSRTGGRITYDWTGPPEHRRNGAEIGRRGAGNCGTRTGSSPTCRGRPR